MPKKKGENKPWKNQDKFSKQQHRRARERVQYGGEKWNTDFRKFNEQVSIYGLYIKDVAGDGNCLFRSISDQIMGHPDDHVRIRAQCVQFIANNRENFEPFIEDDVPFEKYVAQMAKNGTWGGNIELQAMSLAFNVNITIHQLDLPRWEVNNFGNTARNIHVSYHDGEHYNSIRPNGMHTGIPEINEIRVVVAPNQNIQNKPKEEDLLPSPNEHLVIISTNCSLETARKYLKEFYGDVDATIEYLIAINQPVPIKMPKEKEPPSLVKKESAQSSLIKIQENKTTTTPEVKEDPIVQMRESLRILNEQISIVQDYIKECKENGEDTSDMVLNLESLKLEKKDWQMKIENEKKKQKQREEDEDAALNFMLEESRRIALMETQQDSKKESPVSAVSSNQNQESSSPKEKESFSENLQESSSEEHSSSSTHKPKKVKEVVHVTNKERKKKQRESKKERGQQKAKEKIKEKQVEAVVDRLGVLSI